MLPAETAGLTISGVPHRSKTPVADAASLTIAHGAVGTCAASKQCFIVIFDVVTS
jgi:hypothetical protein